MKNTKITIEEIETVSKLIEDEASRIRIEKSAKYSDGFQTFYNKFGLLGCQTDLYRKFARMDAFSETNDPILDKTALENNYLDIINYCKLQLAWLRKNHWGQFSWEHKHEITPIIDARGICGSINPQDLDRAR